MERSTDRSVLLSPISRAEKIACALYWLSLLSSLAITLMAFIYNPEIAANGFDTSIVRFKSTLILFGFLALCGITVIVLIPPRYPLLGRTYLGTKITSQNIEALYKLSRFVLACCAASASWSFVAMQLIWLMQYLGSKENTGLQYGVFAVLLTTWCITLQYGMNMSRKLR